MEPTVEDYEAAVKRFLILAPIAMLLCAIAGFMIGSLVAGKGLVGAGFGMLPGYFLVISLDRFVGPGASKYEIAKQLRAERLQSEGAAHRSPEASQPMDAFATWKKYLLSALGMAAIFSAVFFIRSGFRPEMAAGGVVMGAIVGLVIAHAVNNRKTR